MDAQDQQEAASPDPGAVWKSGAPLRGYGDDFASVAEVLELSSWAPLLTGQGSNELLSSAVGVILRDHYDQQVCAVCVVVVVSD